MASSSMNNDAPDNCAKGYHGRFVKRRSDGSSVCFRCGKTWPADEVGLTARPSDYKHFGMVERFPTMDQQEAGMEALFEPRVDYADGKD